MLSTKPADCYSTPEWCYKSLEPYVSPHIGKSFLEPCSGDGRIAAWMRKLRPDLAVTANEPTRGGSDFLQLPTRNCADIIISNPPYSLAQQFIEHGLTVSHTSCWLLRLSFLGSQRRKGLFVRNPVSGLYVLTRRPSFDGKGTDNSEYAWFIWDRLGLFNKHGIIHL